VASSATPKSGTLRVWPFLHAQLNALATSFAEEVIVAIRSGSRNDLLGFSGVDHTGNGRSARVVGGSQAEPLKRPAKKTGENGRLPRRSAEEIQTQLNKIVLLVKTHKGGMRAEEIRAMLGMDPKEMPRILKEGISTRKLTSKGQKRATTYSAK
jgi:hypothetical protein